MLIPVYKKQIENPGVQVHFVTPHVQARQGLQPVQVVP